MSDHTQGEHPDEQAADIDGFQAEHHEAAMPQAIPAIRVVYCTTCGVQLDGLRIGEPCPQCGVPVGSAQEGNAAKSSGKAVAALVLGICSIVGCMFYGLPGLVCGVLAIYFAWATKRDIAEGKASVSSLGMATSGKICGIIGLSLSALFMVLMIAYFAFFFAVLIPQTQNMNQYGTPPHQTVPSQPAQPAPTPPAPSP